MTTTMNTGAASLSDEQRTTIQHAADKLRTVWANHTGDKESRELCHKLEAILATTPQADAAIAAGGAQEVAQSWIDGVAAELWAVADVSGFDDFKLAVGGFLIATALPRVAATVALTDEQIVSIWEGMPDGASGFRKSWGYMQFARALLAASNGEQA